MEEIFIPATGMAMEEAQLETWLKQPGDSIAAGEAIATIETDKVTVDLTAETAGILGPHLAAEGDLVRIGAAVTTVLHEGDVTASTSAGDVAADPPADVARSTQTASTAATPALASIASSVPTSASSTPAAPAEAQSHEVIEAPGRVPRPHALTPRQRRLQRLQIETAARVSTRAAEPVATPPAAAESRTRAADAVARAVAESWSRIPHFAVSREIDVTGFLGYLADLRAAGTAISVTDLLLSAAARAWLSIRPDAPTAVGLSVDTPKRVINVSIPDAGSQDLAGMAVRRRAAVDRARRGLLKPDDFASCEVTLSNLGTHGVDWFTGIIATGQLGLLTIGRAHDSIQAVGETFVNRKRMWVTANLDHRTLDGADGAALLEAFATACSVTLADPIRKARS